MGFAELIVIGVVALLVIGPERLPGTIRTAALYLGKLRRGFNEIKQEVQNELHNDAVMSELRESGKQLHQETQALGQEFKDSAEKLAESATIDSPSDVARSVESDKIGDSDQGGDNHQAADTNPTSDPTNSSTNDNKDPTP